MPLGALHFLTMFFRMPLQFHPSMACMYHNVFPLNLWPIYEWWILYDIPTPYHHDLCEYGGWEFAGKPSSCSLPQSSGRWRAVSSERSSPPLCAAGGFPPKSCILISNPIGNSTKSNSHYIVNVEDEFSILFQVLLTSAQAWGYLTKAWLYQD